MNFRKIFLIGLLLALIGTAAKPVLQRKWQGIREQRRLERFEVDAARTAAYPLEPTAWLEFNIPQQARALRVLTNAAVPDFQDRSKTREEPRVGWRYAIQYELLNQEGDLLDGTQYHFRAVVLQRPDAETGNVQSASWFGDSEQLPTMTRTAQLPFDSATEKPCRLRVRLATHDPEVQEVVVRVYMQYERSDYQQPFVWSRLSPEARERLCRPLVYSSSLLTAMEKQNLARWDWTALPPKGLEGRDYRTRWFYQSAAGPESSEEEVVAAEGSLCGPDQFLVLPLPAENGTVRIVCQRPDPLTETASHPSPSSGKDVRQHRAAFLPDSVEDAPVHVMAETYPPDSQPGQLNRSVLEQRQHTIEIPTTGGWLEMRASAPIVCQAFWTAASESTAQRECELEFALSPLRAFLVLPDRPVEYSITPSGNRPTPYRLSVRRLRTDSPSTIGPSDAEHPSGNGRRRTDASGRTSDDRWEPIVRPSSLAPWQSIEPAIVEYVLLDGQDQVLRRGQLRTPSEPSQYDRVRGAAPTAQVTDPASFYFALSARVRKVRLQSNDESVVVVAATRPLGLTRNWKLPEDREALEKWESDDRTWFMLQPDDAESSLDDNRVVTILSQLRPPTRNVQIAAGDYRWEDFTPMGSWRGRHLLIPREPWQPVRDEAVASVYSRVPLHQTCDVRFRPATHENWIEPRLVYATSAKSPSVIRVWLDNKLWHSFRPRAQRGELVLPRRPADHEQPLPKHQLRIDGDSEGHFFLSQIEIDSGLTYSKRLAPQIPNGPLRFRVTKQTPAAETLILRPYFPREWNRRVRVHVRILDAPLAEGPFVDWTLRLRSFDVLPRTESPGLVLGTEEPLVDGGQRCYFRLAEDLPVGEYTLEVRFDEPRPPTAYATLYRLLPGVHPQRDVQLDSFASSPRNDAPSEANKP